jgi:L,D-transpeptidase YbiS
MKRLWILAVIAGAFAMCAEASGQTPKTTVATAAKSDTALRVVVSLSARRLWVVAGAEDTLLVVPVAVGSGKTLRSGAQTWTFNTPRGIHAVLTKEEDPVWVRPDWAYIEVARKLRMRLAHIDVGKPVVVDDGRVLEIRDRIAGLVDTDGNFTPLPTDEELIFGSVLYVPPIETLNRRVPGQLGPYRLNIGDGVGLHGTADSASVGHAVTHGCLRLYDADIEWLYVHIPIGTRVYIF